MKAAQRAFAAGAGLLLAAAAPAPAPAPTTTTSYSILGYDPISGEFGAAAASEAPLIGMNIDNLDLDAGGVLIHGGPHLNVARTILTALRDDLVPGRAIAVGLAIDDEKEARQVLAISQRGAAAFTGEMLDPVSVQRVGDNYVAAGQRLPTADIIDAMADAFENSGGPLRDRLLGALHAGRQASEEGGLHSAALLVISPRARFATRHRLVDLRVDFVDDDAVAALEILRFKIDSIYEIN